MAGTAVGSVRTGLVRAARLVACLAAAGLVAMVSARAASAESLQPSDPRSAEEGPARGPGPASDWPFLLDLLGRDGLLDQVRRQRKLVRRWIDLEDSPTLDESALLESSGGMHLAGRVAPDRQAIDIRLVEPAERGKPRFPGDFDLDIVSEGEGSVRDFELSYSHLTDLSWSETRRAVNALSALPRDGDGTGRPELREAFANLSRFLGELGRVEEGTFRRAEGDAGTTIVDWRARLDYESIGRRYPTVRDYLERQTMVRIDLADGTGNRLWSFEFEGEPGTARVRALRRGNGYLLADASWNPVLDDHAAPRVVEPWGCEPAALVLEVTWFSRALALAGFDIVTIRLTRLGLEVGYRPQESGASIGVHLREAELDNPLLDRLLGITKSLKLLEQSLALEWAIGTAPSEAAATGTAAEAAALFVETLSGGWKIEQSVLLRTLVYLGKLFGSAYRLSDFLRLEDDFLADLEDDLTARRGSGTVAGPGPVNGKEPEGGSR